MLDTEKNILGKSRSGEVPWTFLTNHAHVLLCLAKNPSERMRDLAKIVGVTERTVQRIVLELEKSGYLEHIRIGRRNFYKIHSGLPLRHDVEKHKNVLDLIVLINGEFKNE